MSTTTDPLRASFTMLDALLTANLADVTAEGAQQRPAPRANNAHWILGHIVYWRCRILEMMGAEPVWPEGEHTVFTGMQKGDPPERVDRPFDAVLTDLAEVRARTAAALGNDIADDVRGHISSLVIHEAYHVGQLGLLRRSLGLPGAVGL